MGARAQLGVEAEVRCEGDVVGEPERGVSKK